MSRFATILAAVMLIAYLASTRRINTDKVRSILDKSDAKYDEAATNGAGQGEGKLATTRQDGQGEVGPGRQQRYGQQHGEGFYPPQSTTPPQYVAHSFNACGLYPGYQPLQNLSSCLAAAYALGFRLLVQPSNFDHSPAPHGCYGPPSEGDSISVTDVRYNPMPGSRSRHYRVICKLATTHQDGPRVFEGETPTTPTLQATTNAAGEGAQATPAEASKYIVMRSNTAQCQQGSQPIESLSSCEAAAEAIGFPHVHVVTSVHAVFSPHGCHFNRHLGYTAYNPFNGSRNSDFRVVCKLFKGEGEVKLSKFVRVRVIENFAGRSRNRWVQEGENSFPLVRGDFGTVIAVDSTSQVRVIFDKDVKKEVRVNRTYLVEDDPPLKGVDYMWTIEELSIIDNVLKNFPQAEDMAAFKCPITKEIFRVPVVASDGRTYEMSALKKASNGLEPNVTNYEMNSLLKTLAEKAVAQQKAASMEAIREAYDKGYDDRGEGVDRHPPEHISVPFFATYEEVEQWKNKILTDKPPAFGAGIVAAFKCPLSLGFFENPVVASDGHTYEREEIKKVLQSSNPLSPLTRDPLSQNLFPNRAMKLLLSRLIQKADLVKKSEHAAEEAAIKNSAEEAATKEAKVADVFKEEEPEASAASEEEELEAAAASEEEELEAAAASEEEEPEAPAASEEEEPEAPAASDSRLALTGLASARPGLAETRRGRTSEEGAQESSSHLSATPVLSVFAIALASTAAGALFWLNSWMLDTST